ncbi:flocculation protein FLO11 isoform X2 [Micropterus dolomieu]|uniref:flocculation protein FLO11 isoform X1 n=1 Tax=Micropterus dolomieu TaxID=147949 RepID=UPI001E8E3CEC|nr:flocculation protein FLO11 isoform X1 [Micropterus dolomieu]XP_045923983.1 flocculation protein FLO11 isoform X2 [Micropterus dolomieu]
MSSEVCPFCGKTYKRLKSHLPHCKAAATSKTPPTKHNATVNHTSSSSQLAAASSTPPAKGEKSTQMLSVNASPQVRKSKKVSVISPATSLSESLSPSSASLPPSTKKKKQKLSEQIKTVTMPSSNTVSLSPSPSPTISEPKKKSLRALIEAAKSKEVSKGLLEGTRSAQEDLPSGSTPFVADPLSSRATAQTETKTTPDKDLDTKPKGASQMKASKTKKAAQSHSTSKYTSSSLESKVNETSARPIVRDNFWVDTEGEIEDLSVNKMHLKSGSGHQARITLQDVKATLGRANATRQSWRKSILSQIETTDLSSKIKPPLPPANQEHVDSCVVNTKTLSDQLPSTSLQHTRLQSVKRKSSKSKQATSIPGQHDGSPQHELASPATPLLNGHLLSQVSQATYLPHTVSVNEGLKVGHHMTGLCTISPSLTQFSRPHCFRLAPQTLPARVETQRVADGLTMQMSQLEVRKQNTADNGTKGALTQQSLGQVRLKELPGWLACKSPSHPREVVEMVQSGWQWYYKKYIDVKKGGVGGLGMLLAGYCVLSYIWSYPHIKRDRWRKYH